MRRLFVKRVEKYFIVDGKKLDWEQFYDFIKRLRIVKVKANGEDYEVIAL